MSELELPAVPADDLSVSATHEGDAVRVRFTGTADMRVSDALDRVLKAVHAEAQGRGAARVDIDFRELEFMNSSCLKSFVTWISLVRELAAEKRYAIRFLSKPETLWQRRSLHALRCFAVDLISIEA